MWDPLSWMEPMWGFWWVIPLLGLLVCLAFFLCAARAAATAPCTMHEPPPMRRRLAATVFVDIAGSTSLLVHHPPEVVLGVVQGFMRLVTQVATAYAGSVKDFEGDGALLMLRSSRARSSRLTAPSSCLAPTA